MKTFPVRHLLLSAMVLLSCFEAAAQVHYEFHPREYVSTDNSRAPQSAFSYDDEAQTFTITASGQNNVAFKMGGEQDDKYFITADDHWFAVSGQGLKTGQADAYLWWINGWNRGSQVPADHVVTDGSRQIFIWNLQNGNALFSGFDFTQPQTVLSSKGTGFLLAVGLTAAATSGTIDAVGYYSDLALVAKYPAVKSALGLTDEVLLSQVRERLDALILLAEQALEKRGGTENDRAELQAAIDHARRVSAELTIDRISDGMGEIEVLESALDKFIQASRTVRWEALEHGMLVQMDDLHIRILFHNDSILRVSKWMADSAVPQSLVVTGEADAAARPSVEEGDGKIVLASTSMRVVFDLREGTLAIYRASGELLVAEMSARLTPATDGPNASYRLQQTFSLTDDEHIYGLGQVQNGKLDMRGVSMNMVQENRSIYIPYFYSSKRYGLYWDNYSPTQFTDNASGTTFTSTGDAIDYYVLAGQSADGVLRSLRHLTGETQLPPLWNFGLYQSKQRYMSAQEVIDVVRKYRELQVPLDCVVQDWQYWGGDNMWNAMEFLNPQYADYRRMIDEVHAMNAKLMISVWANFGPDTKQYKEFGKAGRLIPIQSYPTGQATRPYDVYSQQTRDRFWSYLYQGLMSKGIDALWLDSSEPDDFSNRTTDYDYVTDYEGRTFRSLRNAFPLCHVGGVYDHHLAQPELADKRVSILTRSAFLGMQRTGAFVWSADITSSWTTLAQQIPAACNLSVSGLPYWNSDTGAFFIGNYGGGVTNPSWRRLYTRWTQFSCFCPMMRFHGDQTPREIWQFGEAGDTQGDYDNILRYIRLRYRLLPYLYATAHETVSQGSTFMRSMPVAFEGDASCENVKDQYMFGRSFLVAPVVNSGASRRNVCLPQGQQWFDFWTGTVEQGGQTVSRNTPADLIPLYIPAGTILPWGPAVQYSSEKKWDELEIRIYGGRNGHFTLYEDELDGYGYKQGRFSEIPFTWDDATQTLTIGDRQGEFPGMLKERTFRIVRVTAENGRGDEESRTDVIVRYEGKRVSVEVVPPTDVRDAHWVGAVDADDLFDLSGCPFLRQRGIALRQGRKVMVK